MFPILTFYLNGQLNKNGNIGSRPVPKRSDLVFLQWGFGGEFKVGKWNGAGLCRKNAAKSRHRPGAHVATRAAWNEKFFRQFHRYYWRSVNFIVRWNCSKQNAVPNVSSEIIFRWNVCLRQPTYLIFGRMKNIASGVQRTKKSSA